MPDNEIVRDGSDSARNLRYLQSCFMVMAPTELLDPEFRFSKALAFDSPPINIR
jgi:hypothetical protein